MTYSPVLQAQSVRKSFQGVQALRNTCFDLCAGEVHALVGENGAGKSTLVKVITGALQPDSGVIRIGGRHVVDFNPRAGRERGVAAVYQQAALFPDLTVAENIALSLEPTSWRSIVWWRDRRRRAAELLNRIGSHTSPNELAGNLSMPEQQLVEIAKAIGSGARIVIFDEPTASLATMEVERLFDVIRRMRSEGVGVIYISHRLDEIAQISDRVTVMRDGETIATRDTGTVTRDELIELMAGQKHSPAGHRSDSQERATVLEVRGISQRSRGLQNICFSVSSGEILGMAGLCGAGRTELAETIFGLTPADDGAEIRLHGERIVIDSPARAIAAGIAYVPEDRLRNGVVLQLPIFANTSLACLKEVSRFGLLQSAQERELAAGFMQTLRIKAPTVETTAGSLSGGNQQKVALARWLATKPKLLILDEPTQGVDVGAKAEIHSIIRRLAGEGLAVLLISSEIEELLELSDRVMVLGSGRMRGILPRREATRAGILELAMRSVAT